MKKIRGIIPPMVTPLIDNNTLDHKGTENLLNHICDGGVHGIFILGTNGEGPSLSDKIKREMITHTCNILKGKIPVLVGISDTDFIESINLAEFAAKAGAHSVVVAPPFYFAPAEPELMQYYEHLAEKLPLPFFIYNMPTMTKVDIQPDTVDKLSKLKGAIGYKDSSGNMVNFHNTLIKLEGRDDFSILMGAEPLLADSILFGGDGGVTGGANFAPRLFVDMFNAADKGDIPTVRMLQKRICELEKIYSIGKHPCSRGIKGTKGVLAEMGICSDYMAEPFHAFYDGADRNTLKNRMIETGLI